jgi:hypothetical protein
MCYAGEHTTKVTRLARVNESITEFSTSSGGLAGIAQQWKYKIDSAGAFWNRESTLEKRRAVVRELVAQSENQNRQTVDAVRLLVEKGHGALLDVDRPIEMAMRLGANGGVDAWLLVNE